MIKCITDNCPNYTVKENEKCVVCTVFQDEESINVEEVDIENLHRKFPELSMFQEIAILSFIAQIKESGVENFHLSFLKDSVNWEMTKDGDITELYRKIGGK